MKKYTRLTIPKEEKNSISLFDKVGCIVCMAVLIILIVCNVCTFNTAEAVNKESDEVSEETNDYRNMSISQLIKFVKENNIQFPVPTEEPTPVSDRDIIRDNLGDSEIILSTNTLTKQSLPCAYYDNVNFSSFQAYEPYNPSGGWTKGSDSAKFMYSGGIYIDENGLCRHKVDGSTQFTINNLDDYVVAMGSFYKTHHKCGERFLVITSTGMFTIVTGDEQADCDTDKHNMMIWKDSNHHTGSMIEYLVSIPQLHPAIRRDGTVTSGPVKAIKGEIKYLYKIS